MRIHQAVMGGAIAIILLISTLGCSTTNSGSGQSNTQQQGQGKPWTQPIEWNADIDAATKTAKQAHKDIFIYLTEDG